MSSVAELICDDAIPELRRLFDGSAVAVYMTDAQGYVTYYNPAAERLAGRTPRVGKDRWCVAWRLRHPDGSDMPLDQCPMAIALKENRAVHGMRVLAERPDGARVPVMPFPAPVHNARGELVGAINMLVEITSLTEMEALSARRAHEQAALYQFTDRLYRSDSAEAIYEAALDAIFAGLRCSRASILLFDDSDQMQFVASRGLSSEYRKAVAGHTPWKRGEIDPQPIVVSDIAAAQESEAIKTVIRNEGIAALAFIPLVINRAVIGKFMIYHDRPHAFTDEETDLALTIARQLGFAIERMRARESRRRADAEFRALADNMHQLAWMTEADGWIYWYNKRWFEYTGTTLEEMQGWGWQKVHHPDHVDRVTEKFKHCIAAGEDWEDTFPLRGADGEYRWFLSRALPIRDEEGAVVRWFGTNTDITERLAAFETRQRLISIVENSDDAIISKDLNGVINSWNKGAERLFGYAPDEIIGRSVLTLIPPEYQHEEPTIIGRISRGERIDHYETVRRRKDGSNFYVSLTVSPMKDAEGNIIGASKIARDISERRRADEQRTLLINELNHRVKNTLATVQSLAMQTLRHTERSEDARALFESRLAALSRAHDLLTRQSWAGADLREVAERALAPFKVDASRVRIDGPGVRLSPQRALALSLAIHELATNAAKYGALSNDEGVVRLSWNLDGDRMVLDWVEAGGPPVSPPTRSGFGSRLIERSLSRELGGEARIDYAPSGVRATISAELDALARI